MKEMQEAPVQVLDQEDPLEEGMATHPSIHGQGILVGYNPWVRKIPWRRAWQPTPVFLPEKAHRPGESGGLQSMGL